MAVSFVTAGSSHRFGDTGNVMFDRSSPPSVANDVDLSPRMPDASGEPGWITTMRPRNRESPVSEHD